MRCGWVYFFNLLKTSTVSRPELSESWSELYIMIVDKKIRQWNEFRMTSHWWRFQNDEEAAATTTNSYRFREIFKKHMTNGCLSFWIEVNNFSMYFEMSISLTLATFCSRIQLLTRTSYMQALIILKSVQIKPFGQQMKANPATSDSCKIGRSHPVGRKSWSTLDRSLVYCMISDLISKISKSYLNTHVKFL